jgi:plasmid stabilization system protein ParE
MAKPIRWSLVAENDRFSILEYWKIRNQNTNYSKKLDRIFKKSTKQISNFPLIGRPTEHENIRLFIVKEYIVVYEISPEFIDILKIWDSRQDPEKFKFIKS